MNGKYAEIVPQVGVHHDVKLDADGAIAQHSEGADTDVIDTKPKKRGGKKAK